MIVYAECSFFIPMAASLKEKRSVLKRMTERTKNSYNVSIAEIDHQNLWQRTTLRSLLQRHQKKRLNEK